MMSIDETPGKVITFYSYKGGTGRTMALANVACLLARSQVNDRGVLMVDWDLEAPGLHRFFRGRFRRQFPNSVDPERSIDEHPGLIDLFLELNQGTLRYDQAEKVQTEEEASDLIRDMNVEQFVIDTDIPSLHLIKAGRFDDKYSFRVNTFQWEAFYKRSPWLVRSFAELLAERYQYVLIDSRTGLTDISGICTMLMPDRLVVVFTPNRQSITGVQELTRRATNYRRQSDDLRPLVVFPLPSRIDSTRPKLSEDWRKGNPDQGITGYQSQFEELFKDVYDLADCKLETYFNEVQIQHIADYAYGEEIAVLIEQGDRLSLTRSYENFTERLANSTSPWEDKELAKAKTLAEEQSKVADSTFARLTPDEQHIAKRIFTRLVRLAQAKEGGEDTRLQVSIDDLDPLAQPVVETLASTGLVVTGVDKETGNKTVQVANETLIRGWNRLQTWINEDREFLLWRQRLRAAMQEWEHTGGDVATLLGGALLAEAERCLVERPDDLNEKETKFIQVSRKRREIAKKRRLQALVLAVTILSLFVFLIVRQMKLAEGESKTALSNQLAAQAISLFDRQLDLGLLLSLEANSISDTVTAKSSLLLGLQYNSKSDIASRQPLGQPLSRPGFPVASLAFNENGTILFSTIKNNTIILGTATIGQDLEQFEIYKGNAVERTAFSPNAKLLALVSNDNSIILWSIDREKQLGPSITNYRVHVTSIAFSPDEKTLASASEDGNITLWDIATGQAIRKFQTSNNIAAESITFSPDGKTLASATEDGNITLWDIAAGQSLGQLQTTNKGAVESIVFSPNGKALASASADGTIILWDVNFESWKTRACRLANRNLTQEEWLKYLGTNENYRKTCPDLP